MATILNVLRSWGTATLGLLLGFSMPASSGQELADTVRREYDSHLSDLFDHFHRNPELSSREFSTAKRIADELREAGFTVTERVGGTGVVAILKNRAGPTVMLRADMDGLPIKEDSGLSNQSVATQENQDGEIVPVMHACGHDAHITNMIGAARIMSARRDQWSGTLMLLAQPAEETGVGASNMMKDNLWERFPKPDYALAMHVNASAPAGQLVARFGPVYSGSDAIELIVHGIGAHGASAYRGVDPIVLSSQIVLGLQTIVSRQVPPREAAAITVGSIHSGDSGNIVPEVAVMKLSVRNESIETRKILLDGIRRVAENMGRAAGLPEDLLPEMRIVREPTPPQLNDDELASRLRQKWSDHFGPDDLFYNGKRLGMGAEDFPHLVTEPRIRSYYFGVGSTPRAELQAEAKGIKKAPSHHTPQFYIDSETTLLRGVEATVVALSELLSTQ